MDLAPSSNCKGGFYIAEEKKYDAKAEAIVISTAIAHPEFTYSTPWLKPSSFYLRDNACIFYAIQQLTMQGITTIDAVNLSEAIESNKAVKKTIDTYNLPKLEEYIDLSQVSARHSQEEFNMMARKVVTDAFRREFYKTTVKFQKMCERDDLTLDELSNKVYDDLSGLTNSFVTDTAVNKVGVDGEKFFNEIQDRKSRGYQVGFPTLFPSLDEFVRYERGELTLYSARMKTGKSFLSAATALDLASKGIATLVYDSEMTDSAFFLRLVSLMTNISATRIKTERLSADDESKVRAAIEHLKNIPLFHYYGPATNLDKLYSLCSAKIASDNLSVLIYDYIKPNQMTDDSAEISSYMGRVADALKNRFAGSLNLAVVAFAQLGRTGMIAGSDAVARYVSTSIKFEEKTEDEIEQDGVECGNRKLTVDLNRLNKQHTYGDYIDISFLEGSISIHEAKRHEDSRDPFST